MGIKFDLLEHGHQGGHHDISVASACLSILLRLKDIQHLQGNRQIGIGIIIHIHFPDIGFFLLKVQLFHLILCSFVKIDRLFMEKLRRTEPVHLSDDPAFWLADINDNKIFIRSTAEAYGIGRKLIGHPMPPTAYMMKHFFLLEISENGIQRVRSKGLSIFKRQLKGSTLDMGHQDIQVIRIDERMLRTGIQEELRMPDDVLIQRIAGGNHQGNGSIASASRTSGLLPAAGYGAGITAHNAYLKLSNIDPQLQRVGADHSQYPAGTKAMLNLPSFLRQITAAISADAAGGTGLVPHHPLQIHHQYFHRQTAPGKNNGLYAIFQKVSRKIPCFQKRAPADTQLPVHDGRIVKNQMLPAGRRTVLLHQFCFLSDDPLRQFLWIGYGGRAADISGM